MTEATEHEVTPPTNQQHRALVITTSDVRGRSTGARLRADSLIRAVGSVARTDLAVIGRTIDTSAMSPLGVRSISGLPGPDLRTRLGRFGRVAGISVPYTLAVINPSRTRKAFFDSFPDPYDLTLFLEPTSWYLLGSLVGGYKVVDLDDRMDVFYKRQAWAASLERGRLSLVAPLMGNPSRLRMESRRWARFQSDMARLADLSLYVSSGDVFDTAMDSAIVPNGSDDPGSWSPDPRPIDHPTILFLGFLRYEPNQQAARVLVHDILPSVRRRLGPVSVVIAGEAPDEIHRLAQDPHVTVTGYVDDLEALYTSADVVAVPLQVGSGSRIKIVEAWARGIPVVSTTIGAEGLEALDGEHLLLANAPGDFADALVRLLSDADLRQHLRLTARRRFEERFQWTVIRSDLKRVLEERLEQTSR